jgi:cysteine desulfurase
MDRVYLDYNASTPIAPEVVEAMSRSLKENFGNPSSPHWAGKPARAALAEARRQVAAVSVWGSTRPQRKSNGS